MKNKFDIILLPTNKESNILLSSNNVLHYMSNERKSGYSGTSQHLYIISDEKIKEGDWYIEDGEICQSQKGKHPITQQINESKKIVATTDIIFTPTKDMKNPYVMGIEQSFIRDYVKAFNEGRPIEEVELEVEEFDGNALTLYEDRGTKFKTTPNNEVIIYQDRLFSAGQVKYLMSKAFMFGYEKDTKGFEKYTEEKVLNK